MTKDAILYIDDEKENLDSFEFIFSRDYNIFTTQVVEEGFEIIKNNTIKAVIADQRMPELTGVEFLSQVKHTNPDILRIILTGYIDEGSILNAINKSEVFRYITKPWNREEIKLTLDNAIELYNLKTENKTLLKNLMAQYTILEEEEVRYRLLFESANDGIFVMRGEKIIEANKKCTKLFGYTTKELINKTPADLSPQKQPNGSLSKELAYKKLSLVKEEKSKVFDWLYKRKNGTYFNAEISLTSFSLSNESLVLAMIRDITDRKNLEKKILETMIETEEKERARFAQDLHDEVGPLLSSLKMYISAIKDVKDEKRLKDFTTRSLDLITETISTVRTTSNALSPHILTNFGIKTAIESLIENNQKFIEIQLESNLTNERFNPNVEIVYYRIIKELINNTIKHADASKIEIALNYNTQNLHLVYTDNGKGFNIEDESIPTKNGIGLFNIQNRVKTIGGEYSFVSKKGIRFELTNKTETYYSNE